MTTTLAKVKREYASSEAGVLALLAPGQWGKAEDTGCLVSMSRDGVTSHVHETRARLAGQTSTTGAALIGSAGITGITPNGGSSGGAATLANMLTGFRDSIILKSPYSAALNTIQPTAASYVPLTLKGAASQTANLFEVQNSSASVLSRFDSAGNFYVEHSATNSVALTVSNTSNANTAAHAVLTLSSGGSSGGDPYIRFNVNAATDWTVGSDNSDSDKFKISASSALGTSDALTITTGGGVSIGSTLTVGGTLAATTDLTVGGNASITGTLSVTGTSAFSDTITLLKSSSSTVLASITNSASTSAAHAELLLQASSATGGDPFVLWHTDSTGWAAGIDNSDSDKWKLSQANSLSGTVFAITIDTSSNTVFGGDVSVSRDNSGGTVLGTVSNSNNANAASHAQILASVGGASAGDPSLRFNVSGVVDWTLGADNSDSDSFKISKSTALGTNDYLIVDTSGGVSIPVGALTLSKNNTSTQLIVIENTNNANSAAASTILLSVGGSSAGDAKIRFNVAGVTDWVIGLDNSDSDKFKISRDSNLGTSDIITIDSTFLTLFGGSVSVDGTYLRPPRLTADPGSASEGWMYWNSASKHLRIHNGTSWVDVV